VTGAPGSYDLYTQAQYDGNRTAGQHDVTDAPNTYNLYSLAQVQALNVGVPLLQPTRGRESSR
jgi:hypothetical protein